MFNKRRNDERDRPEASFNEASPELNEPIIQAEPDVQHSSEPDMAQYANGNGGVAKPSVNNLKPSIISEGFEFIGEIRSSGYLTIDGTVLATWKSAKSSKRFSSELFRSAMPDIYESFVVEQPGSRRFLVKG